MPKYPTLFMISKKWFSNCKHSDSQIFLIAGWIHIKFFQKAALKVCNNTDNVYANFFKKRVTKISWIPIKNQTVGKNP